jgi:flagellar protein FlaG
VRAAAPLPKANPMPAVTQTAATGKTEREPSKDDIAAALASINTALKDRAPGLEFSVDHDSDRAVVKVIDKDTQEVIRQMPSQEAIEIAKALDKLQSLMVKQSA